MRGNSTDTGVTTQVFGYRNTEGGGCQGQGHARPTLARFHAPRTRHICTRLTPHATHLHATHLRLTLALLTRLSRARSAHQRSTQIPSDRSMLARFHASRTRPTARARPNVQALNHPPRTCSAPPSAHPHPLHPSLHRPRSTPSSLPKTQREFN